jgi:hypothetical protein
MKKFCYLGKGVHKLNLPGIFIWSSGRLDMLLQLRHQSHLLYLLTWPSKLLSETNHKFYVTPECCKIGPVACFKLF